MIRFWMVLCDSGQGNPAVKHYTIWSAESEAKRLAEKDPGKSFVILEAISKFKTEIPEAGLEKAIPHPGLDVIGLQVEAELGVVEWDPFSEGDYYVTQGVVKGIDPRTGLMILELPNGKTENVDYRRLTLADKQVPE